jgi:phage-related protein
MVDVVLNRASLAPLYPADDRCAAADIEAMLRGLACLEEIVFRSHADLWTVPLVGSEDGEKTFAFAEIVHSFYGTQERHDVAEFFGELQRMAPADAGLGEEQVDLLLNCQVSGPAPGLEATFPAVQAAGMEAIQCALTDGVLASLCRNVQWQCDQMGFVDGQIDHPLTFDHVSTAAHGLAVAERRRKQARSRLTARNFGELKEECFPHLRFGQEVEAQIEAFSANLLGLALKRLWELDEFSRQVAAGALGLSGMEKKRQGIKPETTETMKSYGEERRFRDSNGALRVFEEHVWVDKLYRIHIFVHEETPIVEVGYMGRHLRTMNNPT